jgi:1-acyl-sn-glycerol-3-phosphate acyltransferase
MIAFGLGGALAERFGAVIAFRVDAGTFLASAVLLAMLIPPPQRRAMEETRGDHNTLGDLADGFRYVWGHRRVMELLGIAALIWFCGPLVKCVIPAIVGDVYDGDLQVVGTLRVCLGVGFILGAIIISGLGDALRSEIAITWGLFGIGVSIALFAASVFLPLGQTTLRVIGAVGLIGGGLFGVGVMASFNALLQRIVPDRYRGRVFGVKDVCCMAAVLIATGALGLPEWSNLDRWVGYILIGVAIVAFCAGAITLSVRLSRAPFGRTLTLAENLNEFVAKFWWRLKRIGPSTIPREGPVIVTANHRCAADPLFLHAAAPYRPISFIVANEYTDLPVARFFLKLVECIPVRRDARDVAVTKQALRHLRDGKALGIFIEGGIVPPGTEPDPKDGVAMLALKTEAKVIPAHISGIVYREGIAAGLFSRHRARVRFGPPVDLSEFLKSKGDRDTVRAATRKIYAAIMALAPSEETPPAEGGGHRQNEAASEKSP